MEGTLPETNLGGNLVGKVEKKPKKNVYSKPFGW